MRLFCQLLFRRSRKKSKSYILFWNLHHLQVWPLFLISQKAALALDCYSSVRRSLCWKLAVILSSGTATDNHLVSFIFLFCCVFLSPCNTHCVPRTSQFRLHFFCAGALRSSHSCVACHISTFFLTPCLSPPFQMRSRLPPVTAGLCLSHYWCWSSVFSERWPEREHPRVCIWLPAVFAVCHSTVNWLLQSLLATN